MILFNLYFQLKLHKTYFPHRHRKKNSTDDHLFNQNDNSKFSASIRL